MKKYFLLLIIAASILTSSCNSEGGGIFFQISQEIKQISSEISELSVHQVVEVGPGPTVYARTGRKVWVQSGSSWSDVSKGNYIYNIVEFGGDLYGNINNDDNDLDDGKIMSFNGSSWSLEDNYNADLSLFKANSTYILIKTINSVFSTFSSIDPSATMNNDNSISEMIVDGATINFNNGLLISDSSIFGIDFSGALGTQSPTFSDSVDGDYCGLAYDGANYFLTTKSGQIYSGNATAFTLEGLIDETPIPGSLEVVDIGGTDYLIIGTLNGYYEMNIATSTISTPSATTSISDFDTSYPELATSLVYEVYPSATANVFYLATSNGLWKRNTDGTFSKQ